MDGSAVRRKLSILFGILFVLGTLFIAVNHNLTQKRVLILHSYDPEYSWTRDVNSGLQRVLDLYPEWSVRWHYMDLKRRPWPEARQAAGALARRVVDDWNPDLIIAIDDDAQALVGKHYVNDPHIKIVFAGVNGGVEEYDYVGAKNVAGIFERKQLAAVRDAVLAGHPKSRRAGGPQSLRILHLGDQSHSVKLDDSSIRNFDWKPMTYAGSKLVKTFPEWQTAVLDADKRADVLFISNYRKLARSDADRTLVSPREVVGWTEINSPVPIIGGNGFYVEDGGMFALGASGFEQGSEAGKLAAQILVQGVSPDSLAQPSTREFVVFMRRGQMAMHDFSLPDLYEAFARAMNNYYN